MSIAAMGLVLAMPAEAKPRAGMARHVVAAVVTENDFANETGEITERWPQAGIAPGHAATREHAEGTVFVAWSSTSGSRVAEIDVRTGAHLREVRFAWAHDTWMRIVRRGEQLYVVGGRPVDDDAIRLARLATADLAIESDTVIGHGVTPEIVADGSPAHPVVAAWPESDHEQPGFRLVVVTSNVTRRYDDLGMFPRIAASGDHVDILDRRDIVRLNGETLATVGRFPLPFRHGYPAESRIGAHGDDIVFSTGESTFVQSPHAAGEEWLDAQEDFAMAEDPRTGNIVTSHGYLYDRSWHLLATGEPIPTTFGMVVVSGRAVVLSSGEGHALDLTVVSLKR